MAYRRGLTPISVDGRPRPSPPCPLSTSTPSSLRCEHSRWMVGSGIPVTCESSGRVITPARQMCSMSANRVSRGWMLESRSLDDVDGTDPPLSGMWLPLCVSGRFHGRFCPCPSPKLQFNILIIITINNIRSLVACYMKNRFSKTIGNKGRIHIMVTREPAQLFSISVF